MFNLFKKKREIKDTSIVTVYEPFGSAFKTRYHYILTEYTNGEREVSRYFGGEYAFDENDEIDYSGVARVMAWAQGKDISKDLILDLSFSESDLVSEEAA